VNVEVVDAPLDYKLLLGCNFTYAMIEIVSYVFYTLYFPHNGKIVAIDHLFFAYSSPSAYVGPSIPMINNSQLTTENTVVGMYLSLMDTFDSMALIHHINAMSSRPIFSNRFVPFHTFYFNDTWTLPSLTKSY
jgi:hypothetical protein